MNHGLYYYLMKQVQIIQKFKMTDVLYWYCMYYTGIVQLSKIIFRLKFLRLTLDEK